MFLCAYCGNIGEGRTVYEAYNDLTNQITPDTYEDCCFYEATQIEVELQIKTIKQPTITAKGKCNE